MLRKTATTGRQPVQLERLTVFASNFHYTKLLTIQHISLKTLRRWILS